MPWWEEALQKNVFLERQSNLGSPNGHDSRGRDSRKPKAVSSVLHSDALTHVRELSLAALGKPFVWICLQELSDSKTAVHNQVGGIFWYPGNCRRAEDISIKMLLSGLGIWSVGKALAALE